MGGVRKAMALTAVVSTMLATQLTAGVAHADVAHADVAEDKKAARAHFQDGQRAFKSGDYRHAALMFEEAYKRAPHHAPLWNAGRAWHRAGELTRAANIYARYLREAPPKAPDRNHALTALHELQAKLARLDVHATDVAELTLDGEPLTSESVYVVPGAHVVEGRTVGPAPGKDAPEVVRVSQSVAAGEVVSIALVPPPPAPAPAPVASNAASPGDGPTPVVPRDTGGSVGPSPSSGVSPVFVVVGGALTLAAGGAALWSGLDTNRQREEYLAGPQTQERYDAGKSAELRTNVLLGAAAGLGVITLATAVFLVDWKGRGRDAPRVGAAFGPGSLLLRGAF